MLRKNSVAKLRRPNETKSRRIVKRITPSVDFIAVYSQTVFARISRSAPQFAVAAVAQQGSWAEVGPLFPGDSQSVRRSWEYG